MQVAAVAAQVEDGITNELPGAVEGDVAAALHLENGQVARLAHVARAGVTAQRHDRRVLEQQDHVPPQPTLDPRLGERPLPLERLLVRHQAGLDHVNRAVSHSASLNASSRLPPTDHARPAPHASAPRPIASGSFTCPPLSPGNRAPLEPRPRTSSGVRESPARPLPPCTRSPAPPSARG